MDPHEQYYFAGAFAGSKNGVPVAANLDPFAYDWALSIVQAEGYLLDMAFLDENRDIDVGPHKNLSDNYSNEIQGQNYASIQLQGVMDSWEESNTQGDMFFAG